MNRTESFLPGYDSLTADSLTADSLPAGKLRQTEMTSSFNQIFWSAVCLQCFCSVKDLLLYFRCTRVITCVLRYLTGDNGDVMIFNHLYVKHWRHRWVSQNAPTVLISIQLFVCVLCDRSPIQGLYLLISQFVVLIHRRR